MAEERETTSKMRDYLMTAGRLLWLAFALCMWAYWLLSAAIFLQRAAAGTLPTAASTTTVASDFVPSQVAAERAAAWGVSIAAWSWINVILSGLAFLVGTLTALLVWWRRRTGFGLLTASALLATATETMTVAVYSADLWAPALTLWQVSAVIWPVFFLWLYLFPDGRAVPRRILWFFGPLLALFSSIFLLFYTATFFPEMASPPVVATLEPMALALIIALFVTTLGAQSYRYFKVSGAVERRQTKWFVYSLALTLLLATAFDLLDAPPEIQSLAFMALPVGVGISILRYRLWDIDIIIRKTLQYSVLSALLALVYLGSVVFLQALFDTVIAETPVLIVLSTLLMAALFNPLRRRVQAEIDRRFYRRKYDAAKTLTQFAATARDEVSLDALTAEITRVVQETMEPESVQVWLRPVAGKRQR